MSKGCAHLKGFSSCQSLRNSSGTLATPPRLVPLLVQLLDSYPKLGRSWTYVDALVEPLHGPRPMQLFVLSTCCYRNLSYWKRNRALLLNLRWPNHPRPVRTFMYGWAAVSAPWHSHCLGCWSWETCGNPFHLFWPGIQKAVLLHWCCKLVPHLLVSW